MTLATDPELLDLLARAGCLNPGQTLKKAANVALCHTRESIRAILAYVLARGVDSVSSIEHGIRVDVPTRLFPFGGGAINNRLTDPAQRHNLPSDWRVSVCGIWQSRWNQVHPPGLPSGKRATPSATPAVVQSLERSPEETARLIALTEAREARYGATVDALTVRECQPLLAGHAVYLSALARWEGTGPKPTTLRGALKLALAARDTGKDPATD